MPPLPKSQLRQLARDLRSHQERADHLREQISRLGHEAEAHESILALGRDDRLLDALGEIYADPAQAAELEADPAAFAKRHGVALPRAADVVVHRDGATVRVSLNLTRGPWSYACTWDAERGFAVGPTDQPEL